MFNLTAKQNVDQAPYVSIEKQDRAMRPPMFKQNSPKTKPNSPKATKKSKKQFIKPIPKVVLPKFDIDLYRKSKLVLEYFKLELVIILPEIMEA